MEIPNTTIVKTRESVEIVAEDGYAMTFTKLMGGRWALTSADAPAKEYYFDLRRQAHYLLNP